jgi:Na+/H+ antiporter NhaD/arsenite permease-like protein
MRFATTVVFVFTYVLIAARRLRLLPIGRPGGALAGAVLMVAIGAITPQETYRAINHDTLLLIFGMMLLSVYLDKVGFFVRVGARMAASAKTPWRLLVLVSILAAVGSAFLLNDSICLFLTPVVVSMCTRGGLPLGPYLIALATSSNIGSAATLVGNPQNMIVGSVSHIGFVSFAAREMIPATAGLLINIGLLAWFYRGRLPRTIKLEPDLDALHRVPSVLISIEQDRRLPMVIAVVIGVTIGFLAGLHLGYVALTGAVVLLLFERKDTRLVLERVDWSVLVFFASLFVVVAAFAQTGFVDEAWTRVAPVLDLGSARGIAVFSALMLVGSNLVSNVPMVLLATPHLSTQSADVGWLLLSFVTTIAGNLTLVGSVANIIVAEGAREHYALGFREYSRFGVVSTLLVIGAGAPLVVLMARWFP